MGECMSMMERHYYCDIARMDRMVMDSMDRVRQLALEEVVLQRMVDILYDL